MANCLGGSNQEESEITLLSVPVGRIQDMTRLFLC